MTNIEKWLNIELMDEYNYIIESSNLSASGKILKFKIYLNTNKYEIGISLTAEDLNNSLSQNINKYLKIFKSEIFEIDFKSND